MIKNEKQYKITQKLLAEWEGNLALLLSKPVPNTPDWLYQEQLYAAKQEIKQLRSQIEDYRDVKTGKKKLLNLCIARELPELLIGWRIRNHLTHKQLADKLGMHENQIQKYESQNYSCVSLDTIIKIAEVLEQEAIQPQH